jgi:3-isopropylmalate/(R)-2-methylmalate dehydratase large subunit
MNAPGAHADAPATLVDRLWRMHAVEELGGGRTLLAIDRIFLHERTGAVALKGLAAAGRAVADPARVFCTVDHIVDTTPGRTDATQVPNGRAFITETRSAARAAGVRIFDLGDPAQGIVHVIAPELGLALPGASIVCPDSHTCTQGGLGALAFGIGSSEAEHALATGTLRVRRPRTVRVMVAGTFAAGVGAKDLCLALLARHGAAATSGAVLEYAGTAVTRLSVEGRLTLCNMATEASAFSAVVAPDDTVFQYLAGRPYAPRGSAWEAALAHWRTLRSDPDAPVDGSLAFDADRLAPMVTWGIRPAHSVPVNGVVPGQGDSGLSREAYDRAIHYMGLVPGAPLTSLPIEGAFIGSCTNGRLEDLRAAASVLRGRRVAAGVRALCVPGSSAVRRAAEAEGLDAVFRTAGFEWRESGCSLCFFAGGESFGPGQRVVSSTNRNFESRQGPRTRTHLASPATVAASAVAGRLADARRLAA